MYENGIFLIPIYYIRICYVLALAVLSCTTHYYVSHIIDTHLSVACLQWLYLATWHTVVHLNCWNKASRMHSTKELFSIHFITTNRMNFTEIFISTATFCMLLDHTANTYGVILIHLAAYILADGSIIHNSSLPMYQVLGNVYHLNLYP